MYENYNDIKSRIKESPGWYDQNGTPRYGKFDPEMCPNIYSPLVALMRIACQDCRAEFLVEMHSGTWEKEKHEYPPSKWHYGDPPAHGCIGDTMNCIDLEVIEVWRHDANLKCDADGELLSWVRLREFEGIIEKCRKNEER